MAADDLALCKQAKESSNAPCVGALKERGTSNSPPLLPPFSWAISTMKLCSPSLLPDS